VLKIIIDPFSGAKDLGKGSKARVEFLPGSGVPLKKSEYISFFTNLLKAGDEVLFLPASFALLKDNGLAIKEAIGELKKTFPNGRIEYLDTLSATCATGIIASLCVTVANSGSELQDVMEFALTLIGRFAVVFTVDDIEKLKKDSLFGGLLKDFTGEKVNNKPIFCINNEGRLVLIDKKRGFKAATNALVKLVKANGQNVADYDVVITHIKADVEAQELKESFKEIVGDNVFITCAGTALEHKLGSKAVGVGFRMKVKGDD